MERIRLEDIIPGVDTLGIEKTKIVFNIAPSGNRNRMSYKTFQNIDFDKVERELWFEQIGWYFDKAHDSVENIVFLTQYTEAGYGTSYYLFTGIYRKKNTFMKNKKSEEIDFDILSLGAKFIGRLIFKADNELKKKLQEEW